MKFSVTFQGQASETDDLETFLDGIMDQLGSEPGTDPAIGATGSSGLVEVELVVDAPTLAEALARAASMLERAMGDGPVTIEWSACAPRGPRRSALSAARLDETRNYAVISVIQSRVGMANKSEPFSLRLSAETDALIEAEARRTRRSKGAVVEALAEEALKMRLFPGIAFRGEDWERRAWVIGTALDVWQVVDALRDFGPIERMVRRSDLSQRQIRLAAAYAERFPDEVDGFIEENRRSLDQLLRENPMIDVPSRRR